MKISSKYLLHTAAALLICASVASCADNEMAIGERPALQPGEYPLMLTASVGEMTSRSDGKESWADGDMIAVRIGQYPNVGCYLLNSDGTVMSAEKSLDWHTTEATTVTAWFPYVDLDQDMTVTISDQSQGFEEYDFLTAVEENQIYTKAVNLNFKHQMAKVSCKILPDDGISDAEWNTVKVSIGGFTKASFRNGTLSGDYDDNNKWITPVYDAEASAEKMPVYEALVVPQKMNGEGLIKIDLDVNSNNNLIHKTLIYPLPDDIDELQGGNHYKFTVTVKKDRLEVKSLSASWTDNGEWHPAEPAVFLVKLPENVTLPDMIYSKNVTPYDDHLLVKGNRFTISYVLDKENVKKALPLSDGSPRDVMTRSVVGDRYVFSYYLLSEKVTLEYINYMQVGDYYYSDGSWGPPGLSGLKTPIGVVFKIGAGGDDVGSNYNKGDKWEIHGYAVALKDAVDKKIKWGTGKNAVKTYTYLNYSDDITPYSGYTVTMGIKKWGEDGNEYDAAKAALDYGPKAPESSSGWYLPTVQQLKDVQNIPNRAKVFTDVDGKDVIHGASADKLFYWTCLENKATHAYGWAFDLGPDNKPAKNSKTLETNFSYVRAVLTF